MTSRHASACVRRFALRAMLGAAVLGAAVDAGAAPFYVPIMPTMADRTKHFDKPGPLHDQPQSETDQSGPREQIDQDVVG